MKRIPIAALAASALFAVPVFASAQSAAPTLSFTASKISITSKKPAYADLPTLSWSATDATSCAASGSGWSGSLEVSGSQKVNPPETTAYTITCVSAAGSVSRSITIIVGGSLNSISLTASALAGLAQAANTSATQAATQPTAFAYTWNHNLKTGSSYTTDVSALQTALIREGVYKGKITGGFYSQTVTAVKAFQKKYGIEATGSVGTKTLQKLNELY